MNVTIALDDLIQLHRRADLYDYHKKEIEKRDQEIANINHATAKAVEEWKAKMKECTDVNERLGKECETQAQAISQLRIHIMETEKELAKWKLAENAEHPEVLARAFLADHDTPFENDDVEKACNVIRTLLTAMLKAKKAARELQPVTATAIKNAKDVLHALFRPLASEEALANETVPGDHFQTLYKALGDLVVRLEQEGLA